MKEYHVDGFRFDFTKGFSNTIYGPSDWGSAYDMARIANLKRMANEIWKRNPGALVIFEHLAGNTEEMELANAGILLWGNMNGNYTEGAMGYNENGKSNLTWGVFSNRSWSFPNLVTYIESHDEERLLYKCLQYGKSEGSYSTRELSTALKRAELSSVFLLPLPGPKMIWQFGELGYDYSINTCENPLQVNNDCRLSPKPVVWDYENSENRKNLFKTMGRLNYLKVNYEEFSASSSFTGNLYGEVKWYTLSKGSQHVLCVGNFGTSDKTATVDFPVTGTWYDYFSGAEIYVNTALNTLPLPPGKYMLLTTRKMGDPFAETGVSHLVKPSGNIMIFPNPARDLFYLRSDQPVGKIIILNLTGQVVCHDDIEGKTESVISTGKMMPGIYVVKAVCGEKWITGKLIVH
jgi:1,4-alpha-glucan branching enzyme